MRIFYFGDSAAHSTSRHRADALARLGHAVHIVDPVELAGAGIRTGFMGRVHFRTGYLLVQHRIKRRLRDLLKPGEFDLAWINNGECIGAGVLRDIRRNVPGAVLYVNDDPTGGRDGNRWLSLLGAIPGYDLCTVVRQQNVAEFFERGARRILRVKMGCDEVAHRPLEPAESGPGARAEVVFVGTWMPERGPFLRELIRCGVPLAIHGTRWNRAREWPELQPHWRGGELKGREYVRAIAEARIALGLLSKGNRDLHTTRSAEIPYAGGLLCAERTSEHLEMYRDGEEAVFWADAEECAAVCKRLLSDDAERERIRLNGMRRVRELEIGNEDVCRRILEEMAKIENPATPPAPAETPNPH